MLRQNRTRLKSHIVTRCRRSLIVMWLVGACCLVQAKQLAVVANVANAATDLTTAELVKIFNVRTQSWPDGRPIKLVLRDPSTADMQLVLRKLLAMTPDQAQTFVRAHRRSIVIADSDDAVLKFVATNRGWVGIVDLFSLTNDVKVLKIGGRWRLGGGWRWGGH